MAYKSYAVAGDDGDTVRKFTWEPGGLLTDQDRDYLSYESLFGLLYMSTWVNSVGWRYEGNRLYRISDNAVVSYHREKYKLPTRTDWLSVEPESENALIVEMVKV
jgi:hypothetical protein